MFERTTNYEAAYIGKFPCPDDEVRPALAWVGTMTTKFDGGLTVVAPTKNHFRSHTVLAQLAKIGDAQTPSTLGRRARTRPVVLVFWPTSKDLEQLDEAHNLKALAVVPWREEEIATWRQARGAVDLLGGIAVPGAPTIRDAVAEAAMKSLTGMVNLSTGVSHPRDRSMAIHAFKILKRNRHPYDPAEIRTWAMANGWGAEDARELSELAAGVLAGKAYRAGPSGWNPQIIRMWRKEAGS